MYSPDSSSSRCWSWQSEHTGSPCQTSSSQKSGYQSFSMAAPTSGTTARQNRQRNTGSPPFGSRLLGHAAVKGIEGDFVGRGRSHGEYPAQQRTPPLLGLLRRVGLNQFVAGQVCDAVQNGCPSQLTGTVIVTPSRQVT